MSLRSDLLTRIKKRGKGYIFFPDDFSLPDDYRAILVALHRLVREKQIIRLASGIYYYPKEDPELGILMPSLEEIAYAIAKHDHIKIRTTGAKALNELGLSTQVPMNVVFLTTGKSKKVRIGKGTITFRSENGRRMALQKSTLGKLILAIQEVGKDGIDDDMLKSVTGLLGQYSESDVRREARKASPWVRNILVNILNQRHA